MRFAAKSEKHTIGLIGGRDTKSDTRTHRGELSRSIERDHRGAREKKGKGKRKRERKREIGYANRDTRIASRGGH
jgi:hypothetical protein